MADGEQIYKSAIAQTVILPSILYKSGSIPDPIAHWISQAQAELEKTKEALNTAQNFIADLKQKLDNGELNGKPGPQGEKGEKGDPGKDAPQEAVLYTAQMLDDVQKVQARENIGAADEETVDQLKSDIVYLSSKTASNETKAYDVTDLFTLNGFLNKRGDFVNNASSLCTDYVDAKKGEVYYLYISQDDDITLPIAVYNTDKSFVKGVENKGNSYFLRYLEYTVEEDCLIRISSMNADSSLIYKKEFKNNSETFDEINTKIGQLETYYEDKTQYVFKNRVLIHEIGHCVLFSFHLIDDIYRMVKPEYRTETEEWIYNFIADYGMKIFESAYLILGDEAWAYIPRELEKLVG